MSKYNGVCYYESQQNLSLALEIMSQKQNNLMSLTDYPSNFEHKNYANTIKSDFLELNSKLCQLSRKLSEYKEQLINIDNDFASLYYQSMYINNYNGDNLTSEQSNFQTFTEKDSVKHLIKSLEKKTSLTNEEESLLQYLRDKNSVFDNKDKKSEIEKEYKLLLDERNKYIKVNNRNVIITDQEKYNELTKKLQDLNQEKTKVNSQIKQYEKKVHTYEVNVGLSEQTVWDKLDYVKEDFKKVNSFKSFIATTKHSVIDISLGVGEYAIDSITAKVGDYIDESAFGKLLKKFQKNDSSDMQDELNVMSNYINDEGIVKINIEKANLKSEIEYNNKSMIDKMFTKLINADISGNVKSIYYNYTLSGRNIEKNSTIKYDSLSSEGLSEFGYKSVASAENLVYAVPEGILQLGENVIIDGVGGLINPDWEWVSDNKTKEWMGNARKNSLSMNLSETNAFAPFKSTGTVYGIVKNTSKTMTVAATALIPGVGPVISTVIAGLDKTGSTIQSHTSAIKNEKGYLTDADMAKVRLNGAIQGTIEGAMWYVTFGQGGLNKIVSGSSKVGAKLTSMKLLNTNTANVVSLTKYGKTALQFAKPWIQDPINAGLRDDKKFNASSTIWSSVNAAASTYIYESVLKFNNKEIFTVYF